MVSESTRDHHRPAPAPFGINTGIGALVMVATAVAAGAVTPDISARLLLVAIAVGAFAALTDHAGASVVTAGLGYLLFRGFLVSRFGELTWDTATSLWHLLVFTLALGLGLGLGWIRAVIRHSTAEDDAQRR